ncbi:hypothetical protein ACLB2K_061844 [Fragaria x ananassa]
MTASAALTTETSSKPPTTSDLFYSTSTPSSPPSPTPMEQSNSFKNPQTPWSSDRIGLGATDRRLAFSRQASINLNDSSSATTPFLSRSVSSIDVPPGAYSDENDKLFGQGRVSVEKLTFLIVFDSVFRILRSGNRYMKRLFLLISLNVAYSTAELCIGLFTGRVGLVSDAFHLTFGCGLLTFSLFAMAASRKKPDGIYTYGHYCKRLKAAVEVRRKLKVICRSRRRRRSVSGQVTSYRGNSGDRSPAVRKIPVTGFRRPVTGVGVR